MFDDLEITYAYEASLHSVTTYGENISGAISRLKEKIKHTTVESYLDQVKPTRIDEVNGIDRDFLYMSSVDLPNKECGFYAAVFILYPVFELLSPEKGLKYDCFPLSFTKKAAKSMREGDNGKHGKVMLKRYLNENTDIDINDELANNLAIMCRVHAEYVNDLVSSRKN